MGQFHWLNIGTVKEFQYSYSLCQLQSYYQCLATKLEENESCQRECLNLSLPRRYFSDQRRCNNSVKLSSACENILWDLHRNTEICKSDSKKACNVKEYFPEEALQPEPGGNENSFMVMYFMELLPSSHGERMGKPFKTVYKEYFQIDEFGLIGTVGGTLGLMIGFSFESSITWIFKHLSSFYFKLKMREHDKRVDLEAGTHKYIT